MTKAVDRRTVSQYMRFVGDSPRAVPVHQVRPKPTRREIVECSLRIATSWAVSLSLYLIICLSIYRSICRGVQEIFRDGCATDSLHLSIFPSICQSIPPFIYVSISLSVCLSVSPPITNTESVLVVLQTEKYLPLPAATNDAVRPDGLKPVYALKIRPYAE